MLRWFEQAGNENDVVLSSRVRLARNLSEYRFSCRIDDKEAGSMLKKVCESLHGEKALKGFRYYELMDMEDIQKRAMAERHVISDFLLGQNIAGAFVSGDERNSVMINEEDHIRIQSFAPGMDIEGCYDAANNLDNAIGAHLDYAYDEHFGYLTTCPSNVGTGMKASYTLHLPALSNGRKIPAIVKELGHFGMNMKPVFNIKGTAAGHLYQICNQKTMGQSEKEILSDLTEIVRNIVKQERDGRKYYMGKDRLRIEDEVYKSYGILRYARKMPLSDAMLLLSKLRLGICLGMIRLSEEQPFTTYQITMGILPYNLKILSGNDIPDEDIDELRAEFIRDNLPTMN